MSVDRIVVFLLERIQYARRTEDWALLEEKEVRALVERELQALVKPAEEAWAACHMIARVQSNRELEKIADQLREVLDGLGVPS